MVDSGESTEVVGVKAGIENSTKLVIEKAPTKEKTAKNSESEEDEDEVIPKKVDRAKKPPVRRDTSPRESDSDELSEEEVVPKKTARKQLKSAAIIRRSDDESESEPSASDGSDSDFDFKKASGKKIAAKPKRKAPPTKKASPAKKATPKGKRSVARGSSDDSEVSVSDSGSDYGKRKKAKKSPKKNSTVSQSPATAREGSRRRSTAISKSFKEASGSGSD